jgi:hypothetical protein
MDLAELIGRLRRRWAWVVLAAVVTAAACLLAVYQVSLVPLSVTPKRFSYGTASNALVLDGRRTILHDLAANLKPLGPRSVALADLATSPPLQRDIARRAGVEPDQLLVDTDIQFNRRRDELETGRDQRATELLTEGRPYVVVLRHRQWTVSLDVYALAPDARGAARLVDASTGALADYLTVLQRDRDFASQLAVVVSQTGRPITATHTSRLGVVAPVSIALVLFPSLCILVLFCGDLVLRLRASKADAPTVSTERPESLLQ